MQPPTTSNVWVEKYRPQGFAEIIMEDTNRRFFANIVESSHFPNLLLYGPPGTGKTTTIMNLISEYQRAHFRQNKTNVLHLNASDERGVDIIRNQIYQFVRTNNLFEKGLKFVVLDEVDYMTKNAQQALKYLLLHNKNNVRYCLVCNYISKIDDGVKNEFIGVRFNQLPKERVLELLRSIALRESMSELSEAFLESIRDTFRSDIRSMINYLQMHQDYCGGGNNEEEEPLVVNGALYERVFALFRAGANAGAANADAARGFTRLVAGYNTDARSVIVGFFNHSVRETSIRDPAAFARWVKIFQVLLDNDDLTESTLVRAFAETMLDFFRSCSAAAAKEHLVDRSPYVEGAVREHADEQQK